MNTIVVAAPIPGGIELGAPGVLLAALGLLVAAVPVVLLVREALAGTRPRTAAPRLTAVPKGSGMWAAPA
jgi:hypothetical protein